MSDDVTGEITLPRWETDLGRAFPGELAGRLLALRRALHEEPELSFQEHRTADRLEAALTALGIGDVRRVAGTGVLARVAGRDRSAPAVAIRGDIDALPIQEQTGLPYASRVSGVMHACGHDVHATWAVGAAALLAEQPAAGDVVIILQPAEEQGSGALRMVDAGALDGVRMIFGGHVDRRFAVGQVVADVGPLAASTDSFEIVLAGRGAHAARPHEALDPIVGAAAVITALQQVVSRRLDPADAGVLTIGTIHAGSAPNIIPETAVLSGTLRAVRTGTRTLLRDACVRIATDVAAGYGLTATITFDDGTPPVINESRSVGFARQAVSDLLGADALVPLGILNLAGEDFAHYLERVPGCFLRIGAREAGGDVIPAHSPWFHAAEESILVGASVLAQAARIASASR
jgi:hippurate hydrolase